MSEDDFFYGEEVEAEGESFMPEVKAFERAGRARNIDVGGLSTSGPGGKLEAFSNLSDDEKFRYYLIDFIKRLEGDNIKIDETSQKFLGELSQNLDKIRFKNPKATILGYYILDKGNINTKKLDKIKGVLNREGMQPEDIIRYARLIQNYL